MKYKIIQIALFSINIAFCTDIMNDSGGLRFDMHLLNPGDNTRTSCHV